MILILSIAPVTAATAYDAPQNLTPLQHYLYNESGGYAPRHEPQVQHAPEPVDPYDTAYATDEASNDNYYYYGNHINQGVTGMNLY